MLETPWQVNSQLETLLNNIQQRRSDDKYVIAMDMEWPVDLSTGVQGRVSLLSMALEGCVYLIPVCATMYRTPVRITDSCCQ